MSNEAVVALRGDVFDAARWTTLSTGYRDRLGVEKVNVIAVPPGQRLEETDVDLAVLCRPDTVPPASDWAEAICPYVAGTRARGAGARMRGVRCEGTLACLLTAIEESAGEVHRPGLLSPAPFFRMAIVGGGTMGALALQMARLIGAREVLGVDVNN